MYIVLLIKMLSGLNAFEGETFAPGIKALLEVMNIFAHVRRDSHPIASQHGDPLQ
ncbi:MAG: hypothetical protein V1736_00950 [Pseudomonadota bacterium]